MANKKITDLNEYTSSQVKSYDLFFVTDIDNQETKKIDAANLTNYAFNTSGSALRTGSFTGSFSGIATNALNLLYSGQPNGTASYAISASNSLNSVSSSYALTASYALNGGTGGGGGVNGTFTQTAHGFSIGDAVYNDGNNAVAWFYPASSVYSSDANEVIGVISATASADTFTVSYGGLIDFGSNPPAIFSSIPQNGNALFLSGSLGKLSLIDPSISDSSQISKPVLIKMTDTQAFIINQRGLHASVGGSGGSSDSASYLNYPNSSTASYAITASYAMNGGGGGGTVYYLDNVPIGSIVAHASTTAPAGYLVCTGSYLQIAQYSDLFAVIGRATYDAQVSFGNKYKANIDGTFSVDTNGVYFKIPDLRGKFVRGYNDALLNTGKESAPYDTSSIRKFGDLENSSTNKHWHGVGNVTTTNDDASLLYKVYSGATTTGGNGKSSYVAGESGGSNPRGGNYDVAGNIGTTDNIDITTSETRPVNIALNYYIKATLSNTQTGDLNQITSGQYALNGDVKGTVGASIVTALQGKGISNILPNPGDLLQFDGTTWVPTHISNLMPKYKTWISYNSSPDINWVWNSAIVSNKKPSDITSAMTYKYYQSTLNGEMPPNYDVAYWKMFGITVNVPTAKSISIPVLFIDDYIYIFENDTLLYGYKGYGTTNSNQTFSWNASAGQHTLYFAIINAQQPPNYTNGPVGLSLGNWIDGTNVQYIGTP